jgi:hypothetical protein
MYSELLRKLGGKTGSESFSTPSGFRRAAQQVAEFQRFQDLGHKQKANPMRTTL